MHYKFKIKKEENVNVNRREGEFGATLRKVLVIFLELDIKHTSDGFKLLYSIRK